MPKYREFTDEEKQRLLTVQGVTADDDFVYNEETQRAVPRGKLTGWGGDAAEFGKSIVRALRDVPAEAVEFAGSYADAIREGPRPGDKIESGSYAKVPAWLDKLRPPGEKTSLLPDRGGVVPANPDWKPLTDDKLSALTKLGRSMRKAGDEGWLAPDPVADVSSGRKWAGLLGGGIGSILPLVLPSTLATKLNAGAKVMAAAKGIPLAAAVMAGATDVAERSKRKQVAEGREPSILEAQQAAVDYIPKLMLMDKALGAAGHKVFSPKFTAAEMPERIRDLLTRAGARKGGSVLLREGLHGGVGEALDVGLQQEAVRQPLDAGEMLQGGVVGGFAQGLAGVGTSRALRPKGAVGETQTGEPTGSDFADDTAAEAATAEGEAAAAAPTDADAHVKAYARTLRNKARMEAQRRGDTYKPHNPSPVDKVFAGMQKNGIQVDEALLDQLEDVHEQAPDRLDEAARMLTDQLIATQPDRVIPETERVEKQRAEIERIDGELSKTLNRKNQIEKDIADELAEAAKQPASAVSGKGWFDVQQRIKAMRDGELAQLLEQARGLIRQRQLLLGDGNATPQGGPLPVGEGAMPQSKVLTAEQVTAQKGKREIAAESARDQLLPLDETGGLLETTPPQAPAGEVGDPSFNPYDLRHPDRVAERVKAAELKAQEQARAAEFEALIRESEQRQKDLMDKLSREPAGPQPVGGEKGQLARATSRRAALEHELAAEQDQVVQLKKQMPPSRPREVREFMEGAKLPGMEGEQGLPFGGSPKTQTPTYGTLIPPWMIGSKQKYLEQERIAETGTQVPGAFKNKLVAGPPAIERGYQRAVAAEGKRLKIREALKKVQGQIERINVEIDDVATERLAVDRALQGFGYLPEVAPFVKGMKPKDLLNRLSELHKKRDELNDKAVEAYHAYGDIAKSRDAVDLQARNRQLIDYHVGIRGAVEGRGRSMSRAEFEKIVDDIYRYPEEYFAEPRTVEQQTRSLYGSPETSNAVKNEIRQDLAKYLFEGLPTHPAAMPPLYHNLPRTLQVPLAAGKKPVDLMNNAVARLDYNALFTKQDANKWLTDIAKAGKRGRHEDASRWITDPLSWVVADVGFLPELYRPTSKKIADWLYAKRDSDEQFTRQRVAHGPLGQERTYTYADSLQYVRDEDITGPNTPPSDVFNRVNERMYEEFKEKYGEDGPLPAPPFAKELEGTDYRAVTSRYDLIDMAENKFGGNCGATHIPIIESGRSHIIVNLKNMTMAEVRIPDGHVFQHKHPKLETGRQPNATFEEQAELDEIMGKYRARIAVDADAKAMMLRQMEQEEGGPRDEGEGGIFEPREAREARLRERRRQLAEGNPDRQRIMAEDAQWMRLEQARVLDQQQVQRARELHEQQDREQRLLDALPQQPAEPAVRVATEEEAAAFRAEEQRLRDENYDRQAQQRREQWLREREQNRDEVFSTLLPPTMIKGFDQMYTGAREALKTKGLRLADPIRFLHMATATQMEKMAHRGPIGTYLAAKMDALFGLRTRISNRKLAELSELADKHGDTFKDEKFLKWYNDSHTDKVRDYTKLPAEMQPAARDLVNYIKSFSAEQRKREVYVEEHDAQGRTIYRPIQDVEGYGITAINHKVYDAMAEGGNAWTKYSNDFIAHWVKQGRTERAAKAALANMRTTYATARLQGGEPLFSAVRKQIGESLPTSWRSESIHDSLLNYANHWATDMAWAETVQKDALMRRAFGVPRNAKGELTTASDDKARPTKEQWDLIVTRAKKADADWLRTFKKGGALDSPLSGRDPLANSIRASYAQTPVNPTTGGKTFETANKIASSMLMQHISKGRNILQSGFTVLDYALGPNPGAVWSALVDSISSPKEAIRKSEAAGSQSSDLMREESATAMQTAVDKTIRGFRDWTGLNAMDKYAKALAFNVAHAAVSAQIKAHGKDAPLFREFGQVDQVGKQPLSDLINQTAATIANHVDPAHDVRSLPATMIPQNRGFIGNMLRLTAWSVGRFNHWYNDAYIPAVTGKDPTKLLKSLFIGALGAAATQDLLAWLQSKMPRDLTWREWLKLDSVKQRKEFAPMLFGYMQAQGNMGILGDIAYAGSRLATRKPIRQDYTRPMIPAFLVGRDVANTAIDFFQYAVQERGDIDKIDLMKFGVELLKANQTVRATVARGDKWMSKRLQDEAVAAKDEREKRVFEETTGRSALTGEKRDPVSWGNRAAGMLALNPFSLQKEFNMRSGREFESLRPALERRAAEGWAPKTDAELMDESFYEEVGKRRGGGVAAGLRARAVVKEDSRLSKRSFARELGRAAARGRKGED